MKCQVWDERHEDSQNPLISGKSGRREHNGVTKLIELGMSVLEDGTNMFNGCVGREWSAEGPLLPVHALCLHPLDIHKDGTGLKYSVVLSNKLFGVQIIKNVPQLQQF